MSAFRPTICLDFDGVLHSYTSGWKGHAVIPDPPVPGAIEFIVDLLNAGFVVAICSTRCVRWSGRRAIRRWLRAHAGGSLRGAIDNVRIVKAKPPAILTIDDRAVQFTGTFPTIEAVRAFKPWKVNA